MLHTACCSSRQSSQYLVLRLVAAMGCCCPNQSCSPAGLGLSATEEGSFLLLFFLLLLLLFLLMLLRVKRHPPLLLLRRRARVGPTPTLPSAGAEAAAEAEAEAAAEAAMSRARPRSAATSPRPRRGSFWQLSGRLTTQEFLSAKTFVWSCLTAVYCQALRYLTVVERH